MLTGITLLNKYARITIEIAKREFNSTGKSVKRHYSFEYKADSWGHSHRVIVKVEVNNMGTNIRYIASSIMCIRTKALYENTYCARGAAELHIKDLKTYLLFNRMSFSSFMSNQFGLFMHSATYVLIHTLQTNYSREPNISKQQ